MSSDRSTTTAMAFLRRGRSVSGWKIVPLAGLQANLHDPHIVVDLRSKASGAADIWRPARPWSQLSSQNGRDDFAELRDMVSVVDALEDGPLSRIHRAKDVVLKGHVQVG